MIRKAKEDHYNNNNNNSSGKLKPFSSRKLTAVKKITLIEQDKVVPEDNDFAETFNLLVVNGLSCIFRLIWKI